MTHSKLPRYLLRTGSVLAVAALLSACSSNNNTTAPMVPPPAPPSAEQVARSSLTGLNKSVAELAKLSAADDEAGSALKMAKDYAAMIGTLASDGNSRKARESARKVLDAQKSLQDALMAAKTAKTAAEEAKQGLPADAEPLLVKAVDDAIRKADTQIEATQALLDAEGDASLASYVAMVTGTDEDDLKTAADTGKNVAMAVAAALNQSNIGTVHGTGEPAATVPDANKVILNDATGHTWAEIVGADKIRKERVGADNAAVSVTSVAGLDASDVNSTLTSSGTYTDGQEISTSTYKGIPGTVYCLGDDCAVGAAGTTDAGKLTGSWYFTPTDEKTFYTRNSEGMYDEETYVTYGHWLAGSDASPGVKTFAKTSGAPSANPVNWDAGTDLAASASYSGQAAGRAVHREYDGQGNVTDQHSGRFTADVSLKATFGDNPALGGTVNNFKSPDNPDAVDSTWSVKLKGDDGDYAPVTSGAVENGVAKGSGENGRWDATSYGEAGKRPTGIYGGFTAHFTDGDVAGAYATRKD